MYVQYYVVHWTIVLLLYYYCTHHHWINSTVLQYWILQMDVGC